MNSKKKIIVSMGDPAGIGPDLCIMLAEKKFNAHITIVGNSSTLKNRANLHNKKIQLTDEEMIHRGNSVLTLQDIEYPSDVIPGQPNKKNSVAQFKSMEFIVHELQNNRYDALVTLPISKNMLSDEFINFKGHTEHIASLTHLLGKEVMMLASNNLRVALATTHIPISKVPNSISYDSLKQTLKTLHHDLKSKFKILNPKIIVTGLNPHSGENGDFGSEEIDIIIPLLNDLNSQGYNLIGPIPADTAFTKKYINQSDAFLAMYHDQGLAPFKALSFGKGVNITLGLPFIRTSVDHGTAFDMVGSKNIDPSSFYEAIDMAIKFS